MTSISERAKSLARRYHAIDWALFLVLSVADRVCNFLGTPFCRPFDWTDSTINYPYKKDTFPAYTLPVLLLVTPLFYILFEKFAVKPLRYLLGEPMSMYSSPDIKKIYGSSLEGPNSDALASGQDFDLPNRAMHYFESPIYPWIRAHLWANLMGYFVVEYLKHYAGRLRPDFLARLAHYGYKKNAGFPDPRENPEFYCKLSARSYTLKDGRMSFPSGHSSAYFSNFTILTFFLFAHLRPFARQGSFVRLIIALSPLSVACICAVSRTRDNKHNFSDISVGSVLGVVCAVLAFFTSFRSAGGPLTVYLARSESDVEYLKQCRASLFSTRESAHYQATQKLKETVNGALELSSGVSPPLQSREVDGEGHTAAVYPSKNNIASCTTNVEVIRNMLVTERELNENPNAVSWL